MLDDSLGERPDDPTRCFRLSEKSNGLGGEDAGAGGEPRCGASSPHGEARMASLRLQVMASKSPNFVSELFQDSTQIEPEPNVLNLR